MYFATAEQMERLDEIAVQHGLEIRQMMELAGFRMVELFHRAGTSTSAHICIAVGKGNKGGDGLAAARHLYNHGYTELSIVLAEPQTELKENPAHQLALCEKMGIPVAVWPEEPERARGFVDGAGVIIDALLGYHVSGAPHGAYGEIVTAIKEREVRVISYDIPSGVDPTSGTCYEPCVHADETLTLALPKKLFLSEPGRRASGHITLGDIGIPAFLYDEIEQGSRPEFGGVGVISVES